MKRVHHKCFYKGVDQKRWNQYNKGFFLKRYSSIWLKYGPTKFEIGRALIYLEQLVLLNEVPRLLFVYNRDLRRRYYYLAHFSRVVITTDWNPGSLTNFGLSFKIIRKPKLKPNTRDGLILQRKKDFMKLKAMPDTVFFLFNELAFESAVRELATKKNSEYCFIIARLFC